MSVDAGGRPHQQQPSDTRIGAAAMTLSFPQQPRVQQSSPNPVQAQAEFQFQPQPQFPMRQPQFQFQTIRQQPSFLFKVDKSPASYNTKWKDLHPDSQKCLLQIEERILQYRNESQRLDHCRRLCDSSVADNGFELDAARIIQELRGLSIAVDREKSLVKKLIIEANDLMKNTEFAIHLFLILHPRFSHLNATVTSFVDTGRQSAAVSSTITAPPMPSSARAHASYIGLPKRPSLFFIKTVGEFEKNLAECQKWVEESEQTNVDKKGAFSSSRTLSECLPSVLSNQFDYFTHVAAKVENLHQHVKSIRAAYLGNKRQRGHANDPFLEADRRESAKLEAAARRIHPTLHLPAIPSQPSSYSAGLFASSVVTSGASPILHQSLGNIGGSPGNTPSPAASAFTPSLFSSPSSSAPTSTLSSSFVSSPQSTPSGSTLTPTLFGATSPAFAPTPTVESSPHFFASSPASGFAVGSGARSGTTSRAARTKSRTLRR